MVSKEQAKQKSKPLDSMKGFLAVVFFVFSYAILFVIGSANTQISAYVANIPIVNLFLPIPTVYDIPSNPIWNVSMMFLLMPILGFWIIFFLTDWIEEFFETKHAKTIAFPIIFVVFCLGALFIAIYWMAAESATLSSQTTVNFDFWGELRNSAFYLFMLSGLLGWISRIAVEKINI